MKKKIPKHISKLTASLEDMFDVGNWESRTRLIGEDKDDTAAEIDIDTAYQRITISLYPCFFKSSRFNQRDYLLHEFCHVLTSGLLERLDDFKAGKHVTPQQIKFESEKATSRISNIMSQLMDGNYISKRKAWKEYLKS